VQAQKGPSSLCFRNLLRERIFREGARPQGIQRAFKLEFMFVLELPRGFRRWSVRLMRVSRVSSNSTAMTYLGGKVYLIHKKWKFPCLRRQLEFAVERRLTRQRSIQAEFQILLGWTTTYFYFFQQIRNRIFTATLIVLLRRDEIQAIAHKKDGTTPKSGRGE
jgi:hypothetical protein